MISINRLKNFNRLHGVAVLAALALAAPVSVLAEGGRYKDNTTGQTSSTTDSMGDTTSSQPGTETSQRSDVGVKKEGMGNSAKEKQMSQIKVRDIHKNTAQYNGKQVEVRGEIETLSSGKQAFILDGEGVFNDEVLVVTKSSAAPSGDMGSKESGQHAQLEQDKKVGVKGTVRRMDVSEVESELGTQLDPEIKSEFEGQMPVIFAESISSTEDV